MSEKLLSEEFIKTECIPKCPLECKRTEYERKSSKEYHKFEDIFYYLLASKTKYNPEDFSKPIRDNVLKLNIYYDSLSYIHIVEKPAIDKVALFSNIGGSLGLTLGISLVSIILFIRRKTTIG